MYLPRAPVWLQNPLVAGDITFGQFGVPAPSVLRISSIGHYCVFFKNGASLDIYMYIVPAEHMISDLVSCV